MKARVKATGKIVEISTFQDNNKFPTTYDENELEFLVPNDYWTRLEHTYAGMAMQAIISKQTVGHKLNTITDLCCNIAHTLVEKMKEERK